MIHIDKKKKIQCALNLLTQVNCKYKNLCTELMATAVRYSVYCAARCSVHCTVNCMYKVVVITRALPAQTKMITGRCVLERIGVNSNHTSH